MPSITPKDTVKGLSYPSEQVWSWCKLRRRQRIDKCWSEIQLSGDGFIIPQNTAHDQVTTGTGDNFKRAIESVKGEHHDVVNMVLFQPETTGLQRN